MPTTRRRRVRQRVAPVAQAVIELLRTGELPTGGHAGWWEAFEKHGSHDHARHGGEDRLRTDWLAMRDDLLAAWIREAPGTRPWAWWEFDAPRWQPPYPPRCDQMEWALCRMPEPRRRLGGIGDPAFECLNIWPHFDAGIPTQFVSESDEALYNGRSRDIHGDPIDTKYHEGHFAGRAPRADDPPRFESQAAYLKRHGCLAPAERKRLTAAAFEPERIACDDGTLPEQAIRSVRKY